jgi:hypothetical protein
MLDQAFLEAVQAAFWPIYLLAVGAGALRFILYRQWCIGRAVLALVLGSLFQGAWESGGGYLQWWQHMLIDVPIFILITMPPRHYWQSVLGALVFAQIFLHALWYVVPEMGRAHWLGCISLGFLKCGVLLLWSGGARVEHLLARISGALARLVPASVAGKLA